RSTGSPTLPRRWSVVSSSPSAASLCASSVVPLRAFTGCHSTPLPGCAPAGDRRHDTHYVTVLGRRVLLRQVADVFVVDVHVHETAQLALVGKQVFAQVPKLAGQVPKRFAHRPGHKLRRVSLPCVNAQGGWNHHFHWHSSLLTSSLRQRLALGPKEISSSV